MPISTHALVLDRLNTHPEWQDVTIDEPGPDEVRVQLVASGVCHTDIIWMRDARELPVVLGHEGAGIVESVGSDVRRVKAGDHVIISWRAACGRCRSCQMGRQPLCESVLQTRERRVHRANDEPLYVLLNAGTFCPFAVIPETAAIRVPPELPLDKAALIGCGVATGVGAALNTAGVKPGESVTIFGTGGVGLNVVQGARLAGAAQIIALDLSDDKLLHARDFGATHTINPANREPFGAILELTGGRGVDHAFDVVGQPAVMEQALGALGQGGVLTLVGNAARDATLSFYPRALLAKQQSIRGCVYGSCRPPIDFPLYAEWYNNGALKLDQLLTNTIDPDALPAEFTRLAAPESIRTVVRF